MVVVAVADNDHVDCGYVGEVAGSFCVSFWAHPGKWRASIFEYRVEQHSETTRELNIVTGMT